jgi:serine/threonine protein kinase
MAEKFQYPAGGLVPGTKYRVIRLLGAGGMGTVYEVEDTTIDKRYVLKTLHATLSTRKDLVERMQREAKALAKLEHRNIVQVITADVTGDSLRLPYFVMQKLNGHTLRTVLDHKGRLEIDASVRLIIDLLNALYHAHEHGIIHRDVKPENIFLHRDPDGLTVPKLLDFGVMATTEAVTVTGQRFIGTLRYAAREQLMGEKVSPRTDLYAAALVLYECLAGRGPFEEEGEAMKVAKAHIDKEPPRLATFRAVPAALEQIVMQSLAKDPAQRHADAFTFAAELHRFLRQLRGSLPPPNDVSTVSDVMDLRTPARPAEAAAAARNEQPTAKPASSGSAETRVDAPVRGATEPASQQITPRLHALDGATPANGQTDRSEGARPTPRVEPIHRGATLKDEAPRAMTLGEEREPARGRAERARGGVPAAQGVDRNALTETMAKPGPVAPPARDGATELIDSMVGEGLAQAGTPPARNVRRASIPPLAEADAAPRDARSSAPPSKGSRSSKDTSVPGSTSRTVSEAAASRPAPRGERVFAYAMGGIVALSLAGAAGFVIATRSQNSNHSLPAATGTATATVQAPASVPLPAPAPAASTAPVASSVAAPIASAAAPSTAPSTQPSERKPRPAAERRAIVPTEPLPAPTREEAPRKKLPGSGL